MPSTSGKANVWKNPLTGEYLQVTDDLTHTGQHQYITWTPDLCRAFVANALPCFARSLRVVEGCIRCEVEVIRTVHEIGSLDHSMATKTIAQMTDVEFDFYITGLKLNRSTILKAD
jgi:hypothetical protein